MPVSVQIEGADRMMTRAEITSAGIRVYFADGKEGLIPLELLNLTEPPVRVMFTSPYELRVFTKTREMPPIPWDFARHFADPEYKSRSERAAVRGKEALGARIKRLRKEKGLTQAELSRRAGISRVSLARIEAGVHSPRLSTLSALADAMHVPLSRLFYN